MRARIEEKKMNWDWVQWYFTIILGIGFLTWVYCVGKGEGQKAYSHEEYFWYGLLNRIFILPVLGRILGWW